MATNHPVEYPYLAPDHPRHADGHPFDEYFGEAYHIKFSTSENTETGEHEPSYELHDGDHLCIGHLHSYGMARFLATALALRESHTAIGITLKTVFAHATKGTMQEGS